MRILILHRIPYYKIQYHRGIDHSRHEVTYVGTREALRDIPSSFSCKIIVRPGVDSTALEVLACIKGHRNFDRVISLSEYELMDAAIVREALGCFGPKLSEVIKTRNKLMMKGFVAMAGLRVPRFASVGVDEIPSWHGMTVLKPVDGASSENVSIHKSPLVALEEFKKQGTDKTFEIEEFIDGDILHFDGIVAEGKLKCILGSRYVGNCLDYAKGKPLGSIQCDLNTTQINWTASCLQAVGIINGAFHLEAIKAERGLVFLEVGNRVGGADVVDTFELATGIHLPTEELKTYLGEALSDKCEKFNWRAARKKFGWFVFPGHHLPQGYCRITGHEEFTTSPLFIKLCQLSEFNLLPRKITYQPQEVAMAGIMKGTSEGEIRSLMSRMFSSVTVRSNHSADLRRSV